MTSGTDLTKVTVLLTRCSMSALDVTSTVLSDSRTDTINRAIQMYAAITGTPAGMGMDFEQADGQRRRLLVLNPGEAVPPNWWARFRIRWSRRFGSNR